MFKYKVTSIYKKFLLFFFDLLGNFLFFIPNFIEKLFYKEDFDSEILVIRLDNMGDMVLSTSFLKNIKLNKPNSKLSVLCRPCQNKILDGLEFIDEIIVFDAFWFGGKDSYKKIINLIIKKFRSYDLVFELHGEFISNFLAYCLGKKRYGFSIRGGNFFLTKYINYDWNLKQSIVEIQFKLLKLVHMKIYSKKLELKVFNQNNNYLSFDKTRKIIVLHPGVSTKQREWDIFNWKELCLKLSIKYNVIVMDMNQKNLNVINNLNLQNVKTLNVNLRDFIYVISKVDLLIGLESLSSHVSAALGQKTISLYSSTTPINLMYPYGKNVVVIRDGDLLDYGVQGLKNISVDQVLFEVDNFFK